MEQPKQYTPEEIAELEKSRELEDKWFLRGGAEYVVDENGEKKNLLVTEMYKKFAEGSPERDKKRQETLSILQKTFDYIGDLDSRDEKLRDISLNGIRSIIFNAGKELYATYNDRGGLRLWNGEPRIESEGHVDWSNNEDIALAQTRPVGFFAIKELMKSVHAVEKDFYSSTESKAVMAVIPKQ